jgi:SAM-dependent methyltransferase
MPSTRARQVATRETLVAIPEMIARAILQEHRYRPLSGTGMLIGRQTMPYTVDQAARFLREEGAELRRNVDLGSKDLIDVTTRHGAGHNYISDVGFFSLFSDAKLCALDVTDYEGADIVHDMHDPVPDSLTERFDFIWNGSCLDNMADPATAIQSTFRMLKPGGRIFMMEIGTPHHNAYTMYSPAFFFDYFAVNDFTDCKVYACMFPSEAVHSGPFDFYVWRNFENTLWQFPMDAFPPNTALISFVIGEKGAQSSWHRKPVQGQYRADHGPYRAAFEAYAKSTRPRLRLPQRTSAVLDHPSIEYVGSW